jgi:DNA-binding response OmpR family regulator
LDRVRVLLVEDDALIALALEATLADAGCRIVGPFPSVAAALRAIAQEPVDCALLDVNLGGEMTFPVADALTAADVPFVWLTGHTPEIVPARHRRRAVLGKPYLNATLVAALSAAVARQC